jgi:hypothetical protein
VDPSQSGGANPQNELTGTLFTVTAPRADTISVSSDYSKLLFWANTAIANLQPGQSIQLAPGTLGYEWDSDVDNGFRPGSLIDLSSTTVNVNTLLANPSLGDGAGVTTGNATHNLTLYRDDSGALVFSAGTVFWADGLDSHNLQGVQADPNVQQSMVNLLAMMGIQPGSLQAGLVAAVSSTDHTAPETTFSLTTTTLMVGTAFKVSGTSADLGGGVVAGVEFSGDGGVTWHKATGLDTWSYAWTPDKIGQVSIEARGIDDSLNVEHTAVAKVYVNFEHPGFDPGYYLAMNPDVKAAGIDPYTHFELYGWHEGRDPSALFSVKDYLLVNPDVAAAGVDPLEHFETFGWKEGRNPSAAFDVNLYSAHNPDVAASGQNPLDQYLVFGQAEGRATYAAIGKGNDIGFDTEYYYFKNPDVAAAKMDAFTHYLEYGASEGRNPNPYFDTAYYLAHNPDVAASGINPLEHYDEYGWKEGRNPSANFDTNAYLAANPDVKAADVDPLAHFLLYGLYEGRDPMGGTTVTA